VSAVVDVENKRWDAGKKILYCTVEKIRYAVVGVDTVCTVPGTLYSVLYVDLTIIFHDRFRLEQISG